MLKYSFEIQCSGANKIYQDCLTQNATSLIIKLKYLDAGPYPSYNCLINTTQDKCGTNCTYLNSNYQLVLIQQVNNKVESAWSGLSNCNIQPNINLIQDLSITTCNSLATSFKRNMWSFLMAFYFVKFLCFRG